MTTPYHFATLKIVLGSYKKEIGYSKLSMYFEKCLRDTPFSLKPNGIQGKHELKVKVT
jgi:hypothetical protein